MSKLNITYIPMQKIVTYLWFNTEAEEAVKFYTSLFKNSKINSLHRYGPGMPLPEGTVMMATFTLAGQDFMALNGGPMFKFTEAISLYVNCDTQEEIDRYWDELAKDGEVQMCGWLKDRYGLSWQIIPARLGEMMADQDPARAGRVMQAVLQMRKMDLGKLEEAYKG